MDHRATLAELQGETKVAGEYVARYLACSLPLPHISLQLAIVDGFAGG